MKKHNILTTIAIFGLILFSGCEKFLEQQPDDRTELNSPVKVAELLANAYPHGNYITMAESMSDNAGDKGTGGRDLPNSLAWAYSDQIDASSEDTPPFYWNSCYKAIAAANYALETIGKAGNTPAYSASKGEALVARAYVHFMLVTFFAKAYDPATAATDLGIPYITAPQKIVEGTYSRGTVASVYANIEKDLTEGLPLIKNESYRVPKYHFTTQAAHAFAARFYLFKKEYQKVIDHADAVFSTATIAANLRPWNTVYNALGYYELQALYTNSTETANLLLQEANSYWGRSYASYNFGLSSAILPIFNAANNPAKKALAMSSKIFGGNETVYNIPKFREHFVKETISATFGNGYNMVPLFTAEELLFNRAEAYANLGTPAGNSQAIADIDAYLSKRIINYSVTADKFTELKATTFFPAPATLKDALVGSILNFKRQEFMHEGLRWLDILRLKIQVKHTSTDGKIDVTLAPDDPRRVVQIPQDAVAAGLAPNPR